MELLYSYHGGELRRTLCISCIILCCPADKGRAIVYLKGLTASYRFLKSGSNVHVLYKGAMVISGAGC